MFFLGITGGVGAGKSEVLSILSDAYGAKVLYADEIAKQLMEPGTPVYDRIREAFSEYGVFGDDGLIDRPRMAQVLFADDALRRQMNAIVHPAVLEAALKEKAAAEAKEAKKAAGGLLVLEAALLLEAGYDRYCDEVWYVYAPEDVRWQRLAASRGYSDERIGRMMKSQLPEEVFRSRCTAVIDNGGTIEETRAQIEALLAEKGIRPKTRRRRK